MIVPFTVGGTLIGAKWLNVDVGKTVPEVVLFLFQS